MLSTRPLGRRWISHESRRSWASKCSQEASGGRWQAARTRSPVDWTRCWRRFPTLLASQPSLTGTLDPLQPGHATGCRVSGASYQTVWLRDLAEELNELSGRLRASRKAMEGAESGTGMEEALERLSRLSEAQAGLNRDAGGLMMMSGTGTPIPADMEAIAARQQRIAEQLRELSEHSGAEALPARPEALASEADEIVRTLRETGIDQETLERQEKLFRQLLDAGRTLEQDPDPNRRESRTAVAGELAAPPNLPEGALAGPLYPYPGEAALRSVSPATRRLILDYFDRLNRSRGGSP